jgi:phosphate starvation-inducible PhoH-like protein
MFPRLAETAKRQIALEDVDLRVLFGRNDVNLRIIEDQFSARILARGPLITIEGSPEDVDRIVSLFDDLTMYLRRNFDLPERYLFYAITMIKENGRGPAEELDVDTVISTLTREPIAPKTIGQKRYTSAVSKYDIVFCIGPAGTGKTYLAVAMAVAELKKKTVQRIVLTRPAVEAGESLGFLPGDIRAKVDPYLRPVYDALHDLVEPEKIKKLMELGIIEIVPLAFMRGRTLNNSFVILDEAQNTTTSQMKMFLTRLGTNSRAIITGDVTQIDLDQKRASGLKTARNILKDVSGIEFVHLDEKDVVRHRLVMDVIKAYEKYENKKKRSK